MNTNHFRRAQNSPDIMRIFEMIQSHQKRRFSQFLGPAQHILDGHGRIAAHFQGHPLVAFGQAI